MTSFISHWLNAHPKDADIGPLVEQLLFHFHGAIPSRDAARAAIEAHIKRHGR